MQSIKIGREGGMGGWKSKWQKAGGGGGGGGWMWSRLSDCQMANIDNSCPPPLPLYILLAGVRPGWHAMLSNSYSSIFSNRQMFFPEMNVSFTWRWQQKPQIEVSATFSWNWYPRGSTPPPTETNKIQTIFGWNTLNYSNLLFVYKMRKTKMLRTREIYWCVKQSCSVKTNEKRRFGKKAAKLMAKTALVRKRLPGVMVALSPLFTHAAHNQASCHRAFNKSQVKISKHQKRSELTYF